jgi:hypothetical protein
MSSLESLHKESVEDVINEIRQSLNSKSESCFVFILVEGDTDHKVYSNFLKNTHTSIEPMEGKENVKIGIERLLDCKKQIIGICDADFSHLESTAPEYDNLFFTDCHDLEMTMLRFSNTRYAFTDYSLQDESSKIIQEAISQILYISYIKWMNKKCDCHLSFDGLNVDSDEFINRKDEKIQLDTIKFVDKLNLRSEGKTDTVTIDDFIKANKTDNYFNLCNGHDTTKWIVQIIRLMKKKNVSHDAFCGHLMASFQLSHFMQTNLYKSMLAWQTINGFDILKTETEALNG